MNSTIEQFVINNPCLLHLALDTAKGTAQFVIPN
jgi:hypothetical protein